MESKGSCGSSRVSGNYWESVTLRDLLHLAFKSRNLIEPSEPANASELDAPPLGHSLCHSVHFCKTTDKVPFIHWHPLWLRQCTLCYSLASGSYFLARLTSVAILPLINYPASMSRNKWLRSVPLHLRSQHTHCQQRHLHCNWKLCVCFCCLLHCSLFTGHMLQPTKPSTECYSYGNGFQ